MLDLDDVKLHLRVDGYAEDNLIEGLMATATAAVASHLDNSTLVLDTTAPAPIKAAALLLLTDLYENRSASTERPLHRNDTFERLLQPYRVMTA